MFTIVRRRIPFPRLKYLANSHIEVSDKKKNMLYIRTSCEYLMRLPLIARKPIAVTTVK